MIPTGLEHLSAETFQGGTTVLSRAGRTMWLGAIAVMLTVLMLFAMLSVPRFGASKAAALPTHSYCEYVGTQYVFVNGSYLDYEKPIYNCVYWSHNHSPFPDWLYNIFKAATQVTNLVASGSATANGQG